MDQEFPKRFCNHTCASKKNDGPTNSNESVPHRILQAQVQQQNRCAGEERAEERNRIERDLL